MNNTLRVTLVHENHKMKCFLLLTTRWSHHTPLAGRDSGGVSDS